MKIKKLDHLSEIYTKYDAFIIDLWGVMHNGIRLNASAINVVEKLEEKDKKIIFLSNAPRPIIKVVKFLKKLKMDQKFLKNVLTSGEAALNSLKKNKFGKKFYHLGPPRDMSVFEKVKQYKTTIENCDFILCTGLIDNHEDNMDYYRNFLKKYTSKKLICTNPDLIVHRGSEEEYCAGYIAQIFEELGGKVIYYGKPYKEIYEMCFKNNEKVLAIGDNLRTDIKGANNVKKDCLFILDGVHRKEFNNDKELHALLKKYNVKVNFYQKELKW